MRDRSKLRETKWEKLDNTANLFPVIATENMTNVYRISVTLEEEVIPEQLQKALIQVLPWFHSMNVRLRTGVFWYYFESNKKVAPLVEEEHEFPCRYIEPHANRNFLFRVTYYKKRINLEVFHVLADGMGGVTFLKELTYQYLRNCHSELKAQFGDKLSEDTSLNTEDSYLKHFRKGQPRGYKSQPAIHLKGEKLSNSEFGMIHGYLPVSQLKEYCHAHQMSINDYLAGNYMYSIYKEYLHEAASTKPVVLCIPVNLRPFFDSVTTRNFFAMVSASFLPEKEEYTRDEVMELVIQSLRNQITKEKLEKLFSYNVSNQKNLILRAVPLLIKKIAMRYVYGNSAKATTTTLTNIGVMKIEEAYQKHIQGFYTVLSPSKGQNMKGTICSYGDELVITFSSILKDVSVQKRFFQLIAKDGIDVNIESNGVYYE